MNLPESSDKKDESNVDVMYLDCLRIVTKRGGEGGGERERGEEV